MSDTPRTDAAARVDPASTGFYSDRYYLTVDANFARQLERELNTAHALIAASLPPDQPRSKLDLLIDQLQQLADEALQDPLPPTWLQRIGEARLQIAALRSELLG